MIRDYKDALELLISKVEGDIDDSWEDIVDELELDIHPDSLRKAFNVSDFSGYKVAKFLKGAYGEDSSEEQIKQIEYKIRELKKERQKLRDERREYTKHIRAEARYEALKEVLEESLRDCDFSTHECFGSRVRSYDDKRSAILCLSDWHIGSVVDNQWNIYNVDIAKERVNKLSDKVKKYIIDNRISDLAVEINGDCIEGSIHVGCRVESEMNATEQIVTVSKMLAELINGLKPYVRSIKVITTLGNHGRIIANKSDQATESENFEMLIPEFLRIALDDDISIQTSQGFDATLYEFAGKKIYLAHGHNDKYNKAIKNCCNIFGVVPNEVHLGHTHHTESVNDSNTIVCVNGSLKGADNFAIGAVRSVTKPSQNLIIYGEDGDRMMVEICCE